MTFQDIKDKLFSKRTPIEKVIVWFNEYDNDGLDGVSRETIAACKELAELHARIEAMERVVKAAQAYVHGDDSTEDEDIGLLRHEVGEYENAKK